MLYKVEVRTAQGGFMSFPLDDISNGYSVEDIAGLGPVKATLISSSFAKLKGAQFNSSKRETRNIVLTLGFQPDYVTNSVRSLRDQLYSFFMPDSEVSLRFYDDEGLTVDTAGHVETCEPTIFTQDPGVVISIVCFDPDYLGLDPVVLTGSSTSTTTETLVTYDGSVATGIVFVLNVNRTLTEFTIYHRPPDGTLRSMDVAAALVAGDVVTISTVPGSKSATLVRTGTTSSILYGVSSQSNWMQLARGDNNIRIYATGAAIPYSITYTDRYGGL